jgi:hypothetical protein
MLKKRYQLAVTTAALALLLAGCSGGGAGSSSEPAAAEGSQGQSSSAPDAASGQSKADACKIVQDSFAKFGELSGSVDASDPQGAVDTFKQFSSETKDALSSITNDEVKPAATKAATALEGYVGFLEAVLSDPSKAGDMGAQATALQEGFTEAATVCAG